jgi:alkylation response protein AidB-like acyl-CoA dehydrogenase
MDKLLIDDRDQKFVLFEQLELGKLSESKLYADFDEEVYTMVLNEAQKLATKAMMPTNSIGDTEGCTFKDGKVAVPGCFHDLWRLWNQGEWRRLDLPREIGGQGMPVAIGMAANEYFEAANLAFQTLAAMTRGAALLIATHGTEAQKNKYVEKILSGQWTGTMVLTESGAGSDLGSTKTIAEPNADGTYTITGTKAFITGGDTGLTENIIHLALARVKGAPSGTRGLSLFLVPKIRLNPDGSLGEPNDVKIVGVEKKMGIKGSPTCQIAFGEEGKCVGELIGEIDKGMPIFFTMMNESRLIAARHGASVAASAYLHALNYAKKRLQGYEIGAPPGAPQCPLIKHPDVRRMLLMMKSYTEGVRALIIYASYCIDRERIIEDKAERQKWINRTAFLTPVAKAYGSDLSFRVTEAAMQVYGGYGYMKDYPIEQFLRDEKVHSIFEGTNGIQALDLVGRKLLKESDDLHTGLLKDIEEFCNENQGHKSLSRYVETLAVAGKALADASMFITEAGKKDFPFLALYATRYLELFGDVVVGWLLLWQGIVAQDALDKIVSAKGIDATGGLDKLFSENPDAAFYGGKIASARYFISNEVSQATAKARLIMSGDRAALEISEHCF